MFLMCVSKECCVKYFKVFKYKVLYVKVSGLLGLGFGLGLEAKFSGLGLETLGLGL